MNVHFSYDVLVDGLDSFSQLGHIAILAITNILNILGTSDSCTDNNCTNYQEEQPRKKQADTIHNCEASVVAKFAQAASAEAPEGNGDQGANQNH